MELNLQSTTYALLLHEASNCPIENLVIQAGSTTFNKSIKEVIRAETGKDGLVAIKINAESPERSSLEEGLSKDHDFHSLLHLLERERTHAQITLLQRERLHLLGTSPWQASFFPETDQLTADQKNILAFFLPYRSQIRGDMVLTRVCMQEAIGQPIELQLTAPRVQYYPGSRIDDTTVDLDLVIGGDAPKEVPCLKVLLGPVPLSKVHEFVPGGHQRRFLEQAFLPCFLPEGWDWEVQIIVAEADRKFQPSTEEEPALYIDINAIVN